MAALTVGSQVWVKDEVSSRVEREVTLIEDDNTKFTTRKQNTVVVTSKMHVQSLWTTSETAPPEGVADLLELSPLHEPIILQNLFTRYENHNIYTYAGNILIAINPCAEISGLYSEDMMQKYYKDPKTKDPHVFAVADIAYRSMKEGRKSSSILVSGESGAGKTETTKWLMSYFASMCGRSETEKTTIQEKLLQSTPLLEAFGNAKTEWNNNSSRFGKYVDIQFDDKGRISGADIKTYLLEKSRVCKISDRERNYHCFYLVFEAPPEDIEKYGLKEYDATSFHYLNQSDCYKPDRPDDVPTYAKTREAMKTVGIIDEEQVAIFRVVAAILHLGNIEFEKAWGADSSVIKKKSRDHLSMTAKLLMCDERRLEEALVNRVMEAHGQKTYKNLTPEAAALSRDGLARTIYARLFDWLVEKINKSIGKVPNSESKSIGLLDVYGFERFETNRNSSEQFYINYANEKLQKHFNEHVLEREKEVYKQEGIDWSGDAVLKEIEEGKRTEDPSTSSSIASWDRRTKGGRPPIFMRNPSQIIASLDETVMNHEAEEFLEKNEDLLFGSKCPFIIGQLNYTKSIGTGFKEQLQDFIGTLENTKPHYIRCVKPNDELEPDNFKMSDVSEQLHWGGVFEVIRVYSAGYPIRQTFEEFLKRYDLPFLKVLEGMNCKKEKDACKMILDVVGLEGCKIGKTKVFLRNGVLAELDARMAPIIKAARDYETLLQSERQAAEKTKKAYIVAQAENKELSNKLKDAEGKLQDSEALLQSERQAAEKTKSEVVKLQDSVKSLAEKLSIIELRVSSTLSGSAQPETPLIQENQDVLMKCISQDLGYSGGRPVAACIIYKFLLHWRPSEVETTRVFDRIILAIGVDIKAREYNDVLAYLLSNSSTLLLLLQRTPKASGSLLRWAFQFYLRLLRKIAGHPQVEAKCPALLFKEQLTAFCEKTLGMIRDNIKKEISPLLELCIQEPCRTSKASVVEGSSQANVIAQQESTAHWQSIVKILNSYLNIMKANFVFPLLVRKVFTQIFYFINVWLFKSLLDQRDCWSFSNGEYVKTGLAELEQWCKDATEEYAGSAWDELECIRQAVGFLVTHEKPEKTLEEITNYLLPKLSIQQLHSISTMYRDDKYGTQSVSSVVLSRMRVLMNGDSNNAVGGHFLLDDDSSIPFSIDDISKSVQQISIADVDLPSNNSTSLKPQSIFRSLCISF